LQAGCNLELGEERYCHVQGVRGQEECNWRNFRGECAPQTTKNLFNLHIKGTQYGGGQPKGIMIAWDIIQMDGRKETKTEAKKVAKTELKNKERRK